MSDHQLNRREMLKRSALLGVAGVIAPAAFLEACGGNPTTPSTTSGGGTPKAGGKITWALEQDPAYLAPFGPVPTSNHWGNEFIYDSLLQWDKDLNIQPALAESYTTPDDKTYVFKLRKGVKFHNGKDFTSADVKYSFENIMNPPPPGSLSTLSQVPAIASIEVVDPLTIKFLMKKPDASMLGFLAWARYSGIAPVDMYKSINPTTQGIGTGPYKLIEYIPNDHLTFTKNADYWGKPIPYAQDLLMKVIQDEQARVAALRSGAIDGGTFSSDNARVLANDKNLVVLKGLSPAFKEIQFTVKAGENKPWADKRVRVAINHAINRKDIIDKVYGGDAKSSSFIPPGYGPYPLSDADLTGNFSKFDVAKAKQLMADAGFANGFPLTLTCFATPQDFPQAAQVIKENLSAIKIDVSIVPQDTATFAKNNGAGTFDANLTGRGMRGDPNGFVSEFVANAKLWWPGYTVPPQIATLVAQGIATPQPSARTPIYQQLQQALWDECLEIPLVAYYKYQVVNKRLHNMYVALTDFNTGLKASWLG